MIASFILFLLSLFLRTSTESSNFFKGSVEVGRCNMYKTYAPPFPFFTSSLRALPRSVTECRAAPYKPRRTFHSNKSWPFFHLPSIFSLNEPRWRKTLYMIFVLHSISTHCFAKATKCVAIKKGDLAQSLEKLRQIALFRITGFLL